MLYGERLQLAIEHRSNAIGRIISRVELAEVVGCSRQNIGMILTNAKGVDQKLSTASHDKACAYLRVNSDWLLHEAGEMTAPKPKNAPAHLSSGALDLAILYDMIPEKETFARDLALNQASEVIEKIVAAVQATHRAGPRLRKQFGDGQQ